MTHKFFGRGMLCISLALLFTACSQMPAGQSDNALSIVDSLGRAVNLPAVPERIIIAGKANFMINDAVYLFPQAPERVLGLTQARQTETQFVSLLDKDYADKARYTITSNAEEIASAQPDLVLLKVVMKDSLGQELEQLNIPVIYLNLETPEQYKTDIAILGEIFDDPARATKIWQSYQTLLDTLQQGLQGVPENDSPDVLLMQYSSSGGEEAFQVPPVTWIQTQMVELAGGKPVWGEASEGNWAVINFEQIAAWNPDQIYVLSYFENPDGVVDNLKADSKWQELSAVKNDLIFGFPKDFYSWDQPDARWFLGLTWLAQHVHPELFGDVDISQAFYSFYTDLYNLDTATVNQHILPLVQGVEITKRGN